MSAVLSGPCGWRLSIAWCGGLFVAGCLPSRDVARPSPRRSAGAAGRAGSSLFAGAKTGGSWGMGVWASSPMCRLAFRCHPDEFVCPLFVRLLALLALLGDCAITRRTAAVLFSSADLSSDCRTVSRSEREEPARSEAPAGRVGEGRATTRSGQTPCGRVWRRALGVGGRTWRSRAAWGGRAWQAARVVWGGRRCVDARAVVGFAWCWARAR